MRGSVRLLPRPRNTDDYVDLWTHYIGGLDVGLFRIRVLSALSGTRQSGMFMVGRNTIHDPDHGRFHERHQRSGMDARTRLIARARSRASARMASLSPA